MHALRPISFVPTRLAVAALLLSLPLAAQGNCPRKQASHVPAAWQIGVTVDCGGITIAAGGGSYNSTVRGCPLSAVFLPPHEIEAPSAQDTQVQVIGNSPIELFTYECHSDWFLFIKIGSSCLAQGHQNMGQLPRLATAPCAPTGAVAAPTAAHD